MKYLTCLLLVVIALLATGCAALGQALGVSPNAQAPAYSGVGVVILGEDNTARLATRSDQSGAVGAEGSATQSADQSVEVPAEIADSMIAAAQQLIAAGNPVAASGILDALKSKPKAEKPAKPAPAAAGAAPAAPAPEPAPAPAATHNP